MQGEFNNDRYVSTDWFRREQDQIFSKLWIFYCPLAMVDRPNRFMTREIAGVPVVVQNFDGELRAFRNVCLHRQSKLQREDFGERRLICSYHGWRYDREGAVMSIPLNNEYHQIGEEEACGLKLPRYHLKTVGQLLFINLADAPLPIEEQFSAQVLADMTSASESFDREVLVSKITCKFNWKLIYENLRDLIHVPFLHPSTLGPEVVIDTAEIAKHLNTVSGSHQLVDLSAGGMSHPFTRDMAPTFASKVERWGNTDGYFEWRLFPNTHVVSPNGGYTFSIEHHHPIGPDTTEITIYYFTAKTKGALPASIYWEYMQAAKGVLDEDNYVMEEIQAGLARGPRFATLGAGERHIGAFQNWIAARVGRAN
jgi:phenylpropionate dioxygenase-like ring-hydroxylating dioxygenase large terminal subunit